MLLAIQPLFDALTATPRRRLALWTLSGWLITRALDVALTLATLSGPVTTRFQRWVFFDALFYGYIAQHGYYGVRVAAYFPLYPLLISAGLRLGLSWPAAALAVSNLALLAALLACGWLVWRETGSETTAIWAIIALSVSPLGVFLAGMYSDGLFIALAALAWLAARGGHWRWAGVALSLAVVTRPFGVALALALAVEFVCQRRPWREAVWLVLPSCLTLGGFLATLWRAYGDPWEPFAAATAWSRSWRWPWQTLALTARQIATAAQGGPGGGYALVHLLLDLTPLVVCVIAAAIMARRWPVSFTSYLLLVVGLVMVTPVVIGPDALVSAGRYCYAAAPVLSIPIGRLLAQWRWPASGAAVALSLAFQLALTAFVLHGGWLV